MWRSDDESGFVYLAEGEGDDVHEPQDERDKVKVEDRCDEECGQHRGGDSGDSGSDSKASRPAVNNELGANVALLVVWLLSLVPYLVAS